MNEEEHERVIQRILVALDDSANSRSALEAAAELAAHLGAELHGLFVEDANLLRLAELPFLFEFSIVSAGHRRLDSGQMQREMRVRARRARQSFTQAAARKQVQGSFRVSRGAITEQMLVAAEEVDLLVLGRIGHGSSHRGRLGATVRALLPQAPRMTMILGQGACLGAPVLVVYDGSAAAGRALAVAAALPGHEEEPLQVLINAATLEPASLLREQVATWLQQNQVLAHIHALTQRQLAHLSHLLRRRPCGTLILPAAESLLQEEALVAFLNEVQVPVIIVR